MNTFFAYILTFTHVDSAGADPQTFSACSNVHLLDGPASGSWVPCTDESSIRPLKQAVVDVITRKTPLHPGNTDVRLMKRTSGKLRLTPLDGRFFIGQDATLAAVGTAADGTVYTVASPKILAKGKIVAKDDALISLTLTIQPSQVARQQTFPVKPLLGYKDALAGDGATSVVVTPYNPNPLPSAWTMFACIIPGRAWPTTVGSSDTQTLWANWTMAWGIRLTNSWKYTFFLDFANNAGRALTRIDGPEIEPEERLYVVSCRVDLAPGGGGVDARFGVDGVYTDASSVTNDDTSTLEAFQMFRDRTTATTVMGAIMGGMLLFDAWITDDALAELNNRRAFGDEDDLVLFYPGDVDSGDLQEYADVNAAAPLNSTSLVGVTETSLFESDEDGIRVLPQIYAGQNVPMHFVDPPRLIGRFTNHPVEQITYLGDRGDASFTKVWRYTYRDFVDNAPGVGEAAILPWGGLVQFEALPDAAVVTADINGCSVWEMSLALGTDHGVSVPYVTFPSAMNPGGNDFAFELWFNWKHTSTFNASRVFVSNYVRIQNVDLPNVPQSRFVVTVFTANGAGSIVMNFDAQQFETVALRVEAWNSGSDAHARTLINGKVIDSGSRIGQNLSTSFIPAPTLSVAGSAFVFEQFLVLPLRLWGPGAVGATDAEAEANHQEFLFQNPSGSHTDILGLWYRTTTSVAQLDDEGPSAWHATINNAGTTGRSMPGLDWSDPLAASVYTLTEKGPYALADITISDAAYQNIKPRKQNLVIKPSSSVAQAATLAIGPGYILFEPDETVSIGQIVAATAGNAVGTITADEILTVGGLVDKSRPPSRVQYSWGEVASTSEVLPTAAANRRSLASAPIRVETVPVPGNAVKYDDLEYPEGIVLVHGPRAWYQKPGVARLDGKRVVTLWTDERPEWKLTLKGGYRAAKPGQIWGVEDLHTQTVAYWLLTQVEQGPDREVWTLR